MWLAGYLEGEGSFVKGPPSAPNSPRITVQSTDEDVIQMVAALFGRAYFRPRSSQPHFKQCFATHIKGAAAIDLMILLRPYMGSRRQESIDAAIASGAALRTPLTPRQCRDVRDRHAAGESLRSLGRRFDVSHETIRRIVHAAVGESAVPATPSR